MNIGKKAPDFKAEAVINKEVKTISLSDFNNMYKVIFFYPFDFSKVCPTEIRAFEDDIDKFKELNTQVIGISTDSVYSHLTWVSIPKSEGGLESLSYPLVSDITKSISCNYNVLDKDKGVAYRGVYIVDKNNIIQAIYINNLSIGRNIKEVLRLVKAIQFVSDHDGKVCVANWKA